MWLTVVCECSTQSWKPDHLSSVCTFDACCLQSCTKNSATPRADHVNFTSPGWIFLSRNLILSVNIDLSSTDNDAIILPQNCQQKYHISYLVTTVQAVYIQRRCCVYIDTTFKNLATCSFTLTAAFRQFLVTTLSFSVARPSAWN